MTRKFITTLLILVLTLSGTTRALASMRDDHAELTPEEEQEARELAISFLKRLRETNDFGKVASEFLPDDFGERIKKFIRAESPDSDFFTVCAREVLLQDDASELRRAYVAVMNFWNQQWLLDEAAWEQTKVEYKIKGKDAAQEKESWDRSSKLTDNSVPEEAFRIAQTDPLLDGLFNFIRHDDNGDGKSDADAEAMIKAAGIHSVARLHAFTDKLERCIPLLHKGVEKLRSETATLRAVNCVVRTSEETKKDSAEEFKIYHLDSRTLDTETFGLAKGALLIRARIYPYEMVMTRIGGRLKIIAVYPDFDGD
jgi:hypothetical protein